MLFIRKFLYQLYFTSSSPGITHNQPHSCGTSAIRGARQGLGGLYEVPECGGIPAGSQDLGKSPPSVSNAPGIFERDSGSRQTFGDKALCAPAAPSTMSLFGQSSGTPASSAGGLFPNLNAAASTEQPAKRRTSIFAPSGETAQAAATSNSLFGNTPSSTSAPSS